jgi:excisionase family DNA binding protein
VTDSTITVPEAARRLRINVGTVYRMIHTGVLPAYRLPGRQHLVVQEADLHKATAPIPVAITGPGESETIAVSRAAAALHTRVSSVHALIRNGDLKTIQTPNGRERILVSSLRAYLNGDDGGDFLADDQAAS